MSGEFLAVVLGAVCGTLAVLPICLLALRSTSARHVIVANGGGDYRPPAPQVAEPPDGGIMIENWPTRTKILVLHSDAQ